MSSDERRRSVVVLARATIPTVQSHVLFIGGRSGVGKSSAALAMHELLKRADMRHAVIEGDYLDLAHPAPHETPAGHLLAERNLHSMWTNYRALGYRRLIYTNTNAVLVAEALAAAMGDEPAVTTVLLRAADDTTDDRLRQRNHGAVDTGDLDHRATTARRLDAEAAGHVHRVDTDGLRPVEIAGQLIELTGW